MKTALEYRIMTEEEYPHGASCPVCKRFIEPGQPYSEYVVAVATYEGLDIYTGSVTVPVTRVFCVYCEPSEESV